MRIGPARQPHLLHTGGQGTAQQGAQVARILQAIEGQHKTGIGGLGRHLLWRVPWLAVAGRPGPGLGQLVQGQGQHDAIGLLGGGNGGQHLGADDPQLEGGIPP